MQRLQLETLLADLRQSLRALRRNPGFTLVALAALTVGIGANTGIFSVVNRVLLQALPYQDSERLVQLGPKYPAGVLYTNSIPKYMVWRNNDVFSSISLYDQEGLGFNVSVTDHPQQVKGAHVSADYFKVFAVSPIMGRGFSKAKIFPTAPEPLLFPKISGEGCSAPIPVSSIAPFLSTSCPTRSSA